MVQSVKKMMMQAKIFQFFELSGEPGNFSEVRCKESSTIESRMETACRETAAMGTRLGAAVGVFDESDKAGLAVTASPAAGLRKATALAISGAIYRVSESKFLRARCSACC